MVLKLDIYTSFNTYTLLKSNIGLQNVYCPDIVTLVVGIKHQFAYLLTVTCENVKHASTMAGLSSTKCFNCPSVSDLSVESTYVTSFEYNFKPLPPFVVLPLVSDSISVLTHVNL